MDAGFPAAAVFCAGDEGLDMYFVKRGMLKVLAGTDVVKTAKAGDFFGEIALVTNMPHVRSIGVLPSGLFNWCKML